MRFNYVDSGNASTEKKTLGGDESLAFLNPASFLK